MGRGKTGKLERSFVKGLITEAGFLTYPENASTDELNTIIKRKGSRCRRFGIDYEPDSTAVDPGTTISTGSVLSEFYWKSVGNDASLNFLVMQIGPKVYFFDTASEPLSEGFKDFSIVLSDYQADGSTAEQVRNNECQMDFGKGYLFIAHPYCEPIVVEYDADADDIEVTRIVLQIRDFDGVDDSLANDEEPTTLTKEHFYNLRNQGWVKPGSTGVFVGATPPNNYTAPTPPSTSGDYGYYNPWTGEPGNYNEP
jgi:hypothetical protein